jgi:uncharacterized protein
MSDALEPSVNFGAVMHERTSPERNRFVYRLAWLRLPLSRLAECDLPLLGIDRPAFFSLRSADHGPRDGSPLLPWIRDLLEREGLAHCAAGEVVLQTMPRILGYVFNPVSFWYCHDRDGVLRAVLAEVSNTFGERHNYLVHHADLRPIEAGDRLRARKVFHVSPFFEIEGEYRFSFGVRQELRYVTIDYWVGDELRLATRIAGHGVPLTGAAMRRWLLQFPLMTFGVIARIHWQALRLWWKRVPFFSKPELPIEETTR